MIKLVVASPSQRAPSVRALACRAAVARPVVAAMMACTLALLAGAQPASAEECKSLAGTTCAPDWKLSSRSSPTNLPLEGEELKGERDQGVIGEGMIVATVTNLGDANTHGSTTITDQLPAEVELIKGKLVALSGRGVPGSTGGAEGNFTSSCTPSEHKVECTVEKEVPPFEQLELRIPVKIKTKTPSEPKNVVSVKGGAKEETIEPSLKIAGGATSFGIERFELTPEKEDGSTDAEAGTHPFQMTTVFDLNQGYGSYNTQAGQPAELLPEAPAQQRDLTFRIPPGVLGNPLAVPQCSGVDFGALQSNATNACHPNSAIGVASVTFNDPIFLALKTWSVPVFNLVPAPGEPARFGFEANHVPVVLDTSVRTGEDYGVTVSVRESPQSVQVLGATVTLWGVPGDSSHDSARGWNCLGNGHYVEGLRGETECKHHEFAEPKPFLVLPTSCTGASSPMLATVTGNSWPDANGNTQTLSGQNTNPVALQGCGGLPFNPSITVKAQEDSGALQTAGSTPSGMTVEVNMPQKETTLAVNGRAEGDIQATRLALPPEVVANAGAANGLGTCDENGEAGLSERPFGPFEGGFQQKFTPAQASCENGAKIGEVEVRTPFLPNPLKGGLYLGFQHTSPFEAPLALYLIATEEEPIHHEGSKVLIKLAGEVEIDHSTGQLISTFRHTPQAPFETLRIHLFGGGRASQATPARCGLKNAKAEFTAWNETSPGVPKTAQAGHEPAEGFEITSGPGGKPCPSGALPFNPESSAAPTNTQAGAFTHFNLTIGHPDGDQQLTGLTMHLPQGAAAMLASVTPCPIAQADIGACTEASQIGTSEASSGVGGVPLTLPGRVYLTEGFDNAPFGVSVDTPADLRSVGPSKVHLGPFNIGTIIANSTINVDTYTAAATITAVETRIIEATTGETKIPGTALPTMIKGVPVQLKAIHVNVNRESFEFNPTTCAGKSVTGAPIATTETLSGAEGGVASLTSPYPVGGCASLPFHPTFEVFTQGITSKANGASLTVKVTSSPGQANIGKTTLSLPIALPSRLTTIQKACFASTFEANPFGCPEGSDIGTAIVHTPVLKNPLSGHAFLVSHGNEAFPDVEFVLQGEGLLLILDGKTDIKKGITYSRFETLPDAPVSSFETVLPEGPHSALAANGDLCTQSLIIPTTITGQNGAVFSQQTKVKVTGCPPKPGPTPLAKALAKCRKQYKHATRKRISCERQARKRYAKKASSKHKKH